MTESVGNGMTIEESNKLSAVRYELRKVIKKVRELPGHRNYAIAITNMETADLWLADRYERKPNGG